MNSGTSSGSALTTPGRLAERLEQDIRRRGLVPGDRYITASEAATCFNISQATANRAMALLAKREVLLRSRRNGTFIGPKLVPAAAVGAPIVYVIKRDDSTEAFDVVRSDEIIGALRQALGKSTNIQFCFPPDRSAVSHIRPTIKAEQDSPRRVGVIARSCTRDIYQYLIDNAVPTVVLGTPFVGQDELPSIDIDNFHGGRLLMEYLIQRGHDRIAIPFIAEHRPGQDKFLHGLTDAMSEAGRLPNTLRVWTVPPDPLTVAVEIEHLLAQADRPKALIATSEQIGRIAIDVASKAGLAVPGNIEVVFKHHQLEADQRVAYTQLQYKSSLHDMCKQAGAMLERLWEGGPLEQKRVFVPAVLHEREQLDDRVVR